MKLSPKQPRPLAATLVATSALAGMACAASIGVNLTESDDNTTPRPNQTLLATDSAGVTGYVQSNWNNIAPGSTQNAVLQDSTGTATTATMQWSVSLAWGDASAFNDDSSSGDSKLARGYFDDGDAVNFGGALGSASDDIGVTIRVSDVPYAQYAVLLYLSSDMYDGNAGHAGTGTYGNYTVNGTTVNNGTPTAGQSWFEVQNGTPWVLGQNVMLFSGLTSPTLDITIQERDGDIRGSLSGFQIVQVPEPSSAALLAPLAFFAWRRRR